MEHNKDFFNEWPRWPSTKDSNNYSQQCYLFDTFKLAFDSLPSFVEKDCLRYVALFPKDRLVSESDLIEYWVGEGFLSRDCCDVREAIKRGKIIIQLLISINLLEEVSFRLQKVKVVRMHHTFRQFLLQGKFGEFNRILVNEDFNTTHQAMLKKASHLDRAGKAMKFYHALLDFYGILIRLMNIESESDTLMLEKWRHAKIVNTEYEIGDKEWRQIPRCPNIQTLILRNNCLSSPTGISDNFPFLKVLDLSYSSIKVLPSCIGNLKYLQYLNISSTDITSLPIELGRLDKLKCFKLCCPYLKDIPENIIFKLSELQLFEMVIARPLFGKHNFDKFIEEMKCLKNLGILKISVDCFDVVSRLMKIERLARSVTYLHISLVEILSVLEFIPMLQRMPNMEYLEISSSYGLEKISLHGQQDQGYLATLETLRILCCYKLEIFYVQPDCLPFLQNLRKLEIRRCPMLRSICWVKCLPNLIELILDQNDKIKYLSTERGEADHKLFFTKLRFLTLSNLKLLRGIGNISSFLSLEYLDVYRCPCFTEFYNSGVILPNIKKIHIW